MSNYRLNLKTNPPRPELPTATDSPGTRRIEAARKVKGYLKLLLSVPFVVSVLYFGSVLYNHVRVVPNGVETVQDFYNRYGNPPRVDILSVDGRKYYRITGEIPAPLGFPKGNPMYVFDETGRLIAWTGESLGDTNFRAKWNSSALQSMVVAYFMEKFPPN